MTDYCYPFRQPRQHHEWNKSRICGGKSCFHFHLCALVVCLSQEVYHQPCQDQQGEHTRGVHRLRRGPANTLLVPLEGQNPTRIPGWQFNRLLPVLGIFGITFTYNYKWKYSRQKPQAVEAGPVVQVYNNVHVTGTVLGQILGLLFR